MAGNDPNRTIRIQRPVAREKGTLDRGFGMMAGVPRAKRAYVSQASQDAASQQHMVAHVSNQTLIIHGRQNPTHGLSPEECGVLARHHIQEGGAGGNHYLGPSSANGNVQPIR